MKNLFYTMGILTTLSFFIFVQCDYFSKKPGSDGHEGHDHAANTVNDDHSTQPEDGDDHSGHDHSAPVEKIELSEKSKEYADIKISKVTKWDIVKRLELPGEIGLNQDKVCNIVPRYGGIIRELKKSLGERVYKGEILAVVENNETLAKYTIRSPIDGRIIEKNVTIGEFASEETNIYMVADMSTVWINLEVYGKDIENVHLGQRATINVIGTSLTTNTTIAYLAPVYDETTRSTIARAVIVNKKGMWRPGSFVQGIIPIKAAENATVILRKAVQNFKEKPSVFVPDGEKSFKVIPVELGQSNNMYVEITSGLKIGDPYVSNGAFELKAKLVTSTLDPHAGHGH